jgi:hypothetical protein
VYAEEGHSGQNVGGLDGLYAGEQPYTSGGMEKFPKWSQQLFFQRARLPINVSFGHKIVAELPMLTPM